MKTHLFQKKVVPAHLNLKQHAAGNVRRRWILLQKDFRLLETVDALQILLQFPEFHPSHGSRMCCKRVSSEVSGPLSLSVSWQASDLKDELLLGQVIFESRENGQDAVAEDRVLRDEKAEGLGVGLVPGGAGSGIHGRIGLLCWLRCRW